MPAYNESATVGLILRAALAQPLVREIVAVDDGSDDGTGQVLAAAARENPRIRVLRHERNRGKGAALRTALGAVSGDIVLVQDADLEYDPRDYAKLLEPILRGRADIVVGSRSGDGGSPRGMQFWSAAGNRVLTTMSNALTDLDLSDLEGGLKAFRSDVLRLVAIEENRFGVDLELIAKLSRLPGVRIEEVPISYRGRSYAEGKKIGWRDGVAALWCILKYNLLRPRRQG